MGKKERIAELLQIIEDATAEIKSLIDKDDDAQIQDTVPGGGGPGSGPGGGTGGGNP